MYKHIYTNKKTHGLDKFVPLGLTMIPPRVVGHLTKTPA